MSYLERALQRATMLALTLCPFAIYSQSYTLDFGLVQVASGSPATATWTYSNPFTDIKILYSFDPPTDEFSLSDGSLSGSIPPGQTASLTFEFQAPPTITDLTNIISQTLQGTLTWIFPPPDGTETLPVSLGLQAKVFAPFPVSTLKVSNGYNLLKTRLSGTHRLFTTVSWASSTGNLNDLNGIEVDEMLVQTNAALVLSSTPAGSIIDFPFAGNNIQYFDCALPLPWKGQAQGLHFETVKVQPLIGPDGLSPTPDLFPPREGFDDGHWDYSGDLLPGVPTPGAWTLLQEYFWTAPYLKDSAGGEIWKPLGLFPNQATAPWSDIITMQVTQQNGRWVDIVTSVQAGSSYPFDLGAVSVSRSSQKSSSLLQVQWPIVGSTLQSAATPLGPWTDLPQSVTTNFVAIEFGTGNQFFRLKLPQAAQD